MEMNVNRVNVPTSNNTLHWRSAFYSTSLLYRRWKTKVFFPPILKAVWTHGSTKESWKKSVLWCNIPPADEPKSSAASIHLYIGVSALPQSLQCPNRAVSQTVRHETGSPQWASAEQAGRGREILLLCPWAMLNCFSKTDTGLQPCFMAAIAKGGDGCWLGSS